MNTKIDPEIIAEKISLIAENMDKLKFLKELPEDEFYQDFRNLYSTKHLLQISIEAMIDIANHIIARMGLGRPKSYAESFSILAEKNIIEADLSDIFATMAKFRNRVVHLYNTVDPSEVRSILHNNLGDFAIFLEQIRLYIRNSF